jgi:hypothetical protein
MSENGSFAIFSEHGPEGVRDFAYSGARLDSIEDEWHQVVPAGCGLFELIQSLAGGMIVASLAQLLQIAALFFCHGFIYSQ